MRSSMGGYLEACSGWEESYLPSRFFTALHFTSLHALSTPLRSKPGVPTPLASFHVSCRCKEEHNGRAAAEAEANQLKQQVGANVPCCLLARRTTMLLAASSRWPSCFASSTLMRVAFILRVPAPQTQLEACQCGMTGS